MKIWYWFLSMIKRKYVISKFISPVSEVYGEVHTDIGKQFFKYQLIHRPAPSKYNLNKNKIFTWEHKSRLL